MRAEGSSLDLVPVWKVIPESEPDGGAIMIMRDGTYRMLIRAGSVNFDMKSPAEQDGITFSFGEMLNSLGPDFPIQIVVHTKHLDTEAYMRQFERRRQSPQVPAPVRALIEDHVRHFSGQVSSRNLLQREFYVVIPHNVEADPVGERNSDAIPMMGLFKAFFSAAEGRFLAPPSEGDLDEARQQLDIRAHQVQSYLGRIDIPTRRLGELELRTLLYEFFNPDLSTRQKLRAAPQGQEMFPRIRVNRNDERRRRALEGPELKALGPAPGAQPAPEAPRPASRRVAAEAEAPALTAIPLSAADSEQRRRRRVAPAEPEEGRRRRSAPGPDDDAPPPLG